MFIRRLQGDRDRFRIRSRIVERTAELARKRIDREPVRSIARPTGQDVAVIRVNKDGSRKRVGKCFALGNAWRSGDCIGDRRAVNVEHGEIMTVQLLGVSSNPGRFIMTGGVVSAGTVLTVIALTNRTAETAFSLRNSLFGE